MKVCETCGCEIATIDGENQCIPCEELAVALKNSALARTRKRARERRRGRDEAMRSLGLKKVRGALGGTYWE